MKMHTNKSIIAYEIKIKANESELPGVLKKVYGMHNAFAYPEGWNPDGKSDDELKYLIDEGAFDRDKYLPSEPSVVNFGDMRLKSKRSGETYEIGIETTREDVFERLLEQFGINKGTSPTYEMNVPRKPFIKHE